MRTLSPEMFITLDDEFRRERYLYRNRTANIEHMAIAEEEGILSRKIQWPLRERLSESDEIRLQQIYVNDNPSTMIGKPMTMQEFVDREWENGLRERSLHFINEIEETRIT